MAKDENNIYGEKKFAKIGYDMNRFAINGETVRLSESEQYIDHHHFWARNFFS